MSSVLNLTTAGIGISFTVNCGVRIPSSDLLTSTVMCGAFASPIDVIFYEILIKISIEALGRFDIPPTCMWGLYILIYNIPENDFPKRKYIRIAPCARR